MKKFSAILIVLLLLIFLQVFANYPLYAEADSPDILIIHSYELTYQWTGGQDEGIRKTILETFPKANMYTENLDSKRIPEDYIRSKQTDVFLDKYKGIHFDLILATDDIGLEMAIASRKRLRLEVPIGFSGILENMAGSLIGDTGNITGVYEKRGFTRTIELMRLLQPEAKKIVIIHDQSSSSKQLVRKVLAGFDDLGVGKDYVFEFWDKKPYAEILRDAGSLGKDTAVYFISYFQTFDGITKDGKIFCREISAVSSVPMYSLGEIYFGEGIIGGEFLSANLQGEELGRIAVRILHGEKAENIPHSGKSTSYLGVDERMMRKYGISTKLAYPEDTVIINKTHTFYESYRVLVWSIFLTFFVLLGFYLYKIRQLGKMRVLKNSLEKTIALNEALLADKDLLLREVHHRIKNNMTTIKGLLSLQIASEKSESSIASLKEAENRVQSIMMLYDRLYCTDNYRELPVREYLEPLAQNIVLAFSLSDKVQIEAHIDDIILNVQDLTILGILTNELLTNMMKYAFVGRDHGLITLSVATIPDALRVVFQDDGIGLPESVNFEQSTGFGMKMVSMLIEQISGNICIERGNGTKFVIEFPWKPIVKS
jgi:two-component sensor histidine kinase